MSNGYIVGLFKFRDLNDFNNFRDKFALVVSKLIEANGGRFLSRTNDCEFLEGRNYGFHVVVEFNDYEKAKALMQTPTWNELQDVRRDFIESSESSFMLLKGGDILSK